VVEVWWIYIVVVVVLALGIYGFLQIVGIQTKWMTRKTTRTAESMYDNYADPPRKQRQAREKGIERRDDSADQPGG